MKPVYDERYCHIVCRFVADDAALDCIATRSAAKFGVSAEVIAKRLRVEKLWPPSDQLHA